jgi:hypothetical protein
VWRKALSRWIDAIVSLPVEAFQPFTTIKTSLLFATKKTAAEVDAYRDHWNQATAAYGKLRKSEIIQTVLQNERLLNGRAGLRALCKELGLEFSPETNLLDSGMLTRDLVNKIETRLAALPDKKAVDAAYKRERLKRIEDIKQFVQSAPFKDFANGELTVLRRFLRKFYPTSARTVREVADAAYSEILAVADIDWPDYQEKDRYANAWWCFEEVVSKEGMNYEVLFSEAKNIGYKRTKRGEFPRLNDLYEASIVAGETGFPIVNTLNPTSILDRFWAHKHGKGFSGGLNDRDFVSPVAVVGDAFALGLRVSLVRFIQTEFNKIDWGKSARFGQYVQSHRSGEYIPKKYYSADETDLVYVSVNNFSDEQPDLETVVYLKDSTPAKYLNTAIESGDIVFTRSGTIGHAHVVLLPKSGKTYIASHHLLVVKLTATARESRLLPYYLRSEFVKHFLFNFAQGKSQKELTIWSVKNLPCPKHDFSKTTYQKLVGLERKRRTLEEAAREKRREIDNVVTAAIEKT